MIEATGMTTNGVSPSAVNSDSTMMGKTLTQHKETDLSILKC